MAVAPVTVTVVPLRLMFPAEIVVDVADGGPAVMVPLAVTMGEAAIPYVKLVHPDVMQVIVAKRLPHVTLRRVVQLDRPPGTRDRIGKRRGAGGLCGPDA